MTRRGDVVVVHFPFTDKRQSKARPSLVIQNDRDNQKIRKTVIAMITGKMSRRHDPQSFPVRPDYTRRSQLRPFRAIGCFLYNNLHTVAQSGIVRTPGQLSDTLTQKLNDCLKAAMELT